MKTPEESERKSGQLVAQISRGLVRDQNTRRSVMFFVVLAALIMLFLGTTFLGPMLMERPFVFVSYWIICGWLTLLALMLALYDLLALRAIARSERRRLETTVDEAEDDETASS